MPFRIRPDADFTDEFRDAAGRELRRAIATLEQQPDGADEAIHDFRKNLKKVRSLYRLVAREVPDFQKRENARLRDAAKSLSAIRDAAALIGTVEYLKEKARSMEEAEALGRTVAILEARRDWMAEAESGLEQKLQETADVLKEARAALDDVSFSGSGKKAIRLVGKGWRRTARKARAAIARCHDEASAEAFHELRKRTQDFRAYHRLLTPLWPAAMKARRADTKELVDILGHVHDLAVLGALVEAEPQLFTRDDDLSRLLDSIAHRQQEDRRDSLVKAEAVFAGKPAKEAKHIEVLWRAAA
ncbi:CHAD domain-containing protein [Rhizobium sp. P32RR-XVIII]|uniref:CHAD domain-containing protein n=1 Tax=Rhizobium sp. P32RR-XVIII TaxID=2726738 RepID=UPI00145726DF|nr:CHAD domain-containing protein [Rhizobium sp. P32RR-XVIII]NLS05394.1 CHAD domain-containing protein [Rhizobium sp. P32RR-XVIII]